MKKIGHITMGPRKLAQREGEERQEIEIPAAPGQLDVLDQIAVAAMTGLISSRITFPDENVADIAEIAYGMAEAMLVEKVKRGMEKAEREKAEQEERRESRKRA